ncbi:phage tail domain-containing protein [Pediococcus pentosaceus]|uniref:phage tail domain-containing protein n=1 Tax=Pediococcus pentosaceus TaxID=1255 RepID=UPI00294CBE2E|nr:phage tail domain-containing protein [Pediococcus pentosaceus]MDV6381097.1 phage tail family protein [Pediococcus pentosaceus]
MAEELPLAKYSFEFDGIRAYEDLGLVVGHINWPTGTTISHSSQSVPGRYGDIPQGNAYGAKTWQIPISFQAVTDEEYMETLINITRAFTRRAEQGVSFPMRFGTMPDVTYYGTFTALPEATQISTGTNDSQLTLTFVADDPKGYKDPVTVKITDSMFEYTPEGTGEIYPIFRITPKKDMEEIGVAYGSNPTKYVDVGYDQTADEQGNIIDKEPVLVNDPCNGLTTWTNIADISKINFGINGVIDGSVMSNESSISVKRSPNNTSVMYDYGDPLKHTDGKRYGPFIMHQGLPRAVKNFETNFRINHIKNYSRAISGNEVYGIDSNGKCIFRVSMQDAMQGRATRGEIQIGPEGKAIQVYKGYKDWHNGKNYTSYVTIVKQGKAYTKNTKGGKGKGKTSVNYYQSNVGIGNFNNTSFFNQGFVQCRIRKVGLKVWISLWKCNNNNGKTDKYIIKNRVINLRKDQDFDFATIAWHANKTNITEDKLNPQTGKVNKQYNYGWNSITAYSVKEILDDGNGNEPHPVVHAGETVVIDCERNETTLIHGGAVNSLEKRVSLGSTYPSLWGGQSEVIGFNVNPEEVDIEMTYRPTYL